MPRRLIGLSCLFACVAWPMRLAAQDSSLLIDSTPTSSLSTSTAPLAVAPDPEGPDDSALRYYAENGEIERVKLEMSRLKRLYPSWTPPADLYTREASKSGDEGALWSLFSANKLKELRAAILAREKAEPGWVPSDDLKAKVRRKELHDQIMSLWAAARWSDLVALSRSASFNASDVDVDALWSVAEALARSKQIGGALAIYESILRSDSDAHERLATYQKAMGNLPMSSVETLLAQARVLPDGQVEYAPIMVDVVRARISAFLNGARAEPVDPDQVAQFQEAAKASSTVDDVALTAWYYVKLKDYRRALDWFKLAIARGGDAMVAHGLATCLEALGYDREAEEVAYAWRKLINNQILFIDEVSKELTRPAPKYEDPAVLSELASLSIKDQSGEGAQALAWYSYNTCQFDVALEWFRRAAAWRPSETTMFGYALTLQKLGRRAPFFEIANRYDGLFAQVESLVFPTQSAAPATICATKPKAEVARGAMQGFRVPAPAAAAPTRVAAPKIETQFAAPRMPKLDKREFPVSVDPENPLAKIRGGAGEFLPEPSRGPWPLVATRVPGVGPMPYERFGYSLLPAWNGQTAPTDPPYSQQPAPRGTAAGLALAPARAQAAPFVLPAMPVARSSQIVAPPIAPVVAEPTALPVVAAPAAPPSAPLEAPLLAPDADSSPAPVAPPAPSGPAAQNASDVEAPPIAIQDSSESEPAPVVLKSVPAPQAPIDGADRAPPWAQSPAAPRMQERRSTEPAAILALPPSAAPGGAPVEAPVDARPVDAIPASQAAAAPPPAAPPPVALPILAMPDAPPPLWARGLMLRPSAAQRPVPLVVVQKRRLTWSVDAAVDAARHFRRGEQ